MIIYCTPDELKELISDEKPATNTEIIDEIYQAVYQANLSVLKASCDTSANKKQ